MSKKLVIIISSLVGVVLIAGLVVGILVITTQKGTVNSNTLPRQVTGEELYYSDVALFEGFEPAQRYEEQSKEAIETLVAPGRQVCQELASGNSEFSDGEGYLYFIATHSLCAEHIDTVEGQLSSIALEAFNATLFDGTEYLSVLLDANNRCAFQLISYTVGATDEEHILLCNTLRSYFNTDREYVEWLNNDKEEVARKLNEYAGAIGNADTSNSLYNSSERLQKGVDDLNRLLDSTE